MSNKKRYEFISRCTSVQVETVNADSLEEAIQLYRQGGWGVQLDADETEEVEWINVSEDGDDVPKRKWKKLLENT